MLKATGIVRRIDDLGRVVIPKEIRRTMDIKDGDPLEFFADSNGSLVLRKYAPGCVFCGSLENLHDIEGKQVCLAHCIQIGRSTGR